MINLDSEGSAAPSSDSNDFHCVGHVLSTSRADMTIGDWAKSSTIFVARVLPLACANEHLLRRRVSLVAVQ